MQFCEFFFTNFWHSLGGLIWLSVACAAVGGLVHVTFKK